MKSSLNILIICGLILLISGKSAYASPKYPIDFWGDTLFLQIPASLQVTHPFEYSTLSIGEIEDKLLDAGIFQAVEQIRQLTIKKELCDWLAYQLIRKVSNQYIPKKTDYLGYTVTKWFILRHLGYDPLMILSDHRVLLYLRSDDIIYNTPSRIFNGVRYVCLNYHDYGYKTVLNTDEMIIKGIENQSRAFTFKIDKLPSLAGQQYTYREFAFEYGNQKEHINVKLNNSLTNYFINYPVTDYMNQFNIPLSDETKKSLITALKDRTKKMSTRQGVEYIMYFTRYAFSFEKDTDGFGSEKRLSPEETLLYSKSDCEDRSALFYSLIKEIFNIPMIVLEYDDHVTVAVKLEKPLGKPIFFENEYYTVCEPTPQAVDLRLGEQLETRLSKPFEIAFAYHPTSR